MALGSHCLAGAALAVCRPPLTFRPRSRAFPDAVDARPRARRTDDAGENPHRERRAGPAGRVLASRLCYTRRSGRQPWPISHSSGHASPQPREHILLTVIGLQGLHSQTLNASLALSRCAPLVLHSCCLNRPAGQPRIRVARTGLGLRVDADATRTCARPIHPLLSCGLPGAPICPAGQAQTRTPAGGRQSGGGRSRGGCREGPARKIGSAGARRH